MAKKNSLKNCKPLVDLIDTATPAALALLSPVECFAFLSGVDRAHADHDVRSATKTIVASLLREVVALANQEAVRLLQLMSFRTEMLLKHAFDALTARGEIDLSSYDPNADAMTRLIWLRASAQRMFDEIETIFLTQVGHRLLRDVRAVVVQHDTDDSLARVVRIQPLQQGDELDTAVTRLDVGDDLSAVQVQRSQDRQGAVSNVLVIAPNAGVLARHWRQIRRGNPQTLYPRLLVNADGVDRHWPSVVHGIGTVQIHVPVNHQHLGHLALEIGVAPFEVVAHPVRLEFVRIQDAPHRGFGRGGQPGETGRSSVLGDVPGQ